MKLKTFNLRCLKEVCDTIIAICFSRKKFSKKNSHAIMPFSLKQRDYIWMRAHASRQTRHTVDPLSFSSNRSIIIIFFLNDHNQVLFDHFVQIK